MPYLISLVYAKAIESHACDLPLYGPVHFFGLDLTNYIIAPKSVKTLETVIRLTVRPVSPLRPRSATFSFGKTWVATHE